tara:strand:+ start:2640 stop:3140 length:501 start_codon:yes stop_codon:yes gene_type:complete
MPESVPLRSQELKVRAPEPLEEAVEKCVRDIFIWSLRSYPQFGSINVTRADVDSDLIIPAIVIRATRIRESIPTGDVYEMDVSVTCLTLMDQDDDVTPATPAEFTDDLWAAVVALVEDPNFLTILQASRSSVRWHGIVRQGAMTANRMERHAERQYSFSLHVSRLA